jgi:sigma-B regulation protein RsbU (phosphoserine phosphatase)
MATLLTLEGPESGRAFPLVDECSVLGRQHDSTICLSGNAVSRHHAQILRQGGDYFVEDLGSSNGTFVNGEQIQQATLADGDKLDLGGKVLRVRVEKPKVK